MSKALIITAEAAAAALKKNMEKKEQHEYMKSITNISLFINSNCTIRK